MDINSTGEPVKRFDIVKAMSKDECYLYRGDDVVSKINRKCFTLVPNKKYQTLKVIGNLRDRNSKVDRMWEMLVELTMFLRTKFT